MKNNSKTAFEDSDDENQEDSDTEESIFAAYSQSDFTNQLRTHLRKHFPNEYLKKTFKWFETSQPAFIDKLKGSKNFQ